VATSGSIRLGSETIRVWLSMAFGITYLFSRLLLRVKYNRNAIQIAGPFSEMRRSRLARRVLGTLRRFFFVNGIVKSRRGCSRPRPEAYARMFRGSAHLRVEVNRRDLARAFFHCSRADQTHAIMHCGVGGITPITGGFGKYCVVTCADSATSSPNTSRMSSSASCPCASLRSPGRVRRTR